MASSPDSWTLPWRGLGLSSRVQFAARAGVTYRIALCGLVAQESGRASLHWSLLIP